jgi:hypothetical protein
MDNLARCFKCGSPARKVSDGEITCSDSKCRISETTYTLEDWRLRIPSIIDLKDFITITSSMSDQVSKLTHSILEGTLDQLYAETLGADLFVILGSSTMLGSMSKVFLNILENSQEDSDVDRS